MKYPIELYCTCGVKAKYSFTHPDSKKEYESIFKREHGGPGHEIVSASGYRQAMAEKRLAS
jgi:hypothetical protein